MIYLNKLLPLLVSPLIFCLALILFGVWRRQRWVIILSAVVLWLASTPIISDPLFRWIEADAVRAEVTGVGAADAVVVLSGMQMYVPGAGGPTPQWGEAVDRLDGGLEVFGAGKAPVLIFTAGKRPWQRDVEPEGASLARAAMDRGVPQASIRLTRQVENTDQEAKAVRELLAAEDSSHGAVQPPHVILVTSAFHMPRAQALFQDAGLRVTPFPVDFRVSSDGRGPTDYFPDTSALRRTDIAIRELIGRAYYRARALLR